MLRMPLHSGHPNGKPFAELERRLTLVTGFGHKVTQRGYSSGQALNFFSIQGWLHVEHDFYLVWIGLYSTVVDYET